MSSCFPGLMSRASKSFLGQEARDTSHLLELMGARGDPGMAYRQEMNQLPLLSTTAAGEDWAGHTAGLQS